MTSAGVCRRFRQKKSLDKTESIDSLELHSNPTEIKSPPNPIDW